MNTAIEEFLEFLNKEEDTDYGDFKREVDLHLKQLIENMRPLTSEQRWQFQKIREQLLWSYKSNVEEMKSLLKEEIRHLEAFNSSEF